MTPIVGVNRHCNEFFHLIMKISRYTVFSMIVSEHNGHILGHNRTSGKESEHSIIGKIKSIMCIGLHRCRDRLAQRSMLWRNNGVFSRRPVKNQPGSLLFYKPLILSY